MSIRLYSRTFQSQAAASRASVIPNGPSVSNVPRVAATCSSTVVGFDPLTESPEFRFEQGLDALIAGLCAM
jgi:hypothetical protein